MNKKQICTRFQPVGRLTKWSYELQLRRPSRFIFLFPAFRKIKAACQRPVWRHLNTPLSLKDGLCLTSVQMFVLLQVTTDTCSFKTHPHYKTVPIKDTVNICTMEKSSTHVPARSNSAEEQRAFEREETSGRTWLQADACRPTALISSLLFCTKVRLKQTNSAALALLLALLFVLD